VQGPAQLTSAVATLAATDRAGAGPVANHLLVHDLCCPEEQAAEFAAAIARLARRVADWRSIHHVTSADLAALEAAHAGGGPAAAAARLAGCTGTDTADELVLGQNLLFLNHLLHRTHPRATRICYGDGVGLNFSPTYFRPAEHEPGWRGLGRRLERTLRRRVRRWTGRPGPARGPGDKAAHAVPFDRHCLLLANRFDQRLATWTPLEHESFRRLFAAYLPELDAAIAAQGDPLGPALARATRVVVLLTSNFAETDRMTIDAEIDACLAAATSAAGGAAGTLLVIKPHPRDSRAKLARLASAARDRFAAVVALTDRATFHLPFETVYARWFLPDDRLRRSTRVVCTSSAGLTLELLYGQPVDVAFGVDVVRRSFVPRWRALRLRHEADLRRIVAEIRADRRTGRVA